MTLSKLLLLLGLAGVLGVTIFWQDLILTSVVISSEARPTLLRGGEWGQRQ